MDNGSLEEKTFTGIAASPGIAEGPIFILSQKELTIPNFKVQKHQFEGEIQRFETAIVETRKQIQRIQEEIRANLGEEEARIFDAHLLVLEDQALIGDSIREMEEKGINIEKSVWSVGQHYIEAFSQIDDEYLRERASDIRDVLRRLLSNLTGEQLEQLGNLAGGRILVARDIAPSESASVDKSHLLGIVTDAGSKTSHTVIVARSMGIPAVVGMGDFAQHVTHGDTILIDGYDGKVILNPSESTLFSYGKLKSERESIEQRMIALSQKAAKTKDGHSVALMANIEVPDEAANAVKMGADGIGLFRTEYLFMNAESMPTEETQFEAYAQVAETMGDQPVVIRTLDLGGDKILAVSDVQIVRESNPFLGYRAIRFCLDHLQLFKAQLRAVLRASALGNLRLMYPMVSSVGELRKANEILEHCKEELRQEGVAFDENILTGTMIEIPSAAIAADTLVEQSAFFSVGTNDLIQYLLAVDRLNDRVAHLYEPTHPAVIRTLDMIVNAAKAGEIGVSVCGEVAGDPIMVPLLIGFGVDTLSMSPSLIPNVNYVVQNMSMTDARALAEMALAEPDATKILENLLDFYTSLMAELY